MGLLFAIGQTAYLGFEYLNTFGYVDFIRNAAIILPVILFAMFLFGIIDFSKDIINRIRVPYFALRDNFVSNKHKAATIIGALSPVIMFVVGFAWVTDVSFSGDVTFSIQTKDFLFLFIFILMTLLSISFSKYCLPYLEKIDRIRKINQKNTENNLNWFLSLGVFLAPIFGMASIQMQNHEIPDARIEFEDGKSFNVNILASNHKIIAVYLNDEIQIINRDKLRIIAREKNISG